MPHRFALGLTGLLFGGCLGASVWAGAADAPLSHMCDPTTNVCHCQGGWDGPDCAAMKPHCEDGFWRACSDDGYICTCTMKIDAPQPGGQQRATITTNE